LSSYSSVPDDSSQYQQIHHTQHHHNNQQHLKSQSSREQFSATENVVPPRVSVGDTEPSSVEQGEHSPAAYIDPTPQPDVELPQKAASGNEVSSGPDKQDCLTAVSTDHPHHRDHQATLSDDPMKHTATTSLKSSWADGESNGGPLHDRMPSELSQPPALEALSRDPTVVPSTTNHTIPPNTNSATLDTLESQMAALHGAGGANTPWQPFPSYYQH